MANFLIKSSYYLFSLTILCDIYERILALCDLWIALDSAFRNFIWSCFSFYCSILFLNSLAYFYLFLTYSNLLPLNELTDDDDLLDRMVTCELIDFLEYCEVREQELLFSCCSDCFLMSIVFARVIFLMCYSWRFCYALARISL